MSLTHILGRVDGSRVGVARAFLDNVWTDGRVQPLFSPPHLARLCSLGVMLHLSFLLFSMVLAHFFYYLHLFIHPIVISSPRYAFPWPFSLSLDLHRCILVPVFTVVAVTCCVCTCATDI